MDISIQKMSLYNIEWQVLRVGLSFRDSSTVQASLEKLEDYLLEEEKGYDTRGNKLWRVVNLLNATVMGLNGQIKRTSSTERTLELLAMISTIQSFREPFSEEFKHTKNFCWDLVLETESIQCTSKSNLLAVYKSLTKRKSFAKDYKHMDVYSTRVELCWYIELLSLAIDLKGGE